MVMVLLVCAQGVENAREKCLQDVQITILRPISGEVIEDAAPVWHPPSPRLTTLGLHCSAPFLPKTTFPWLSATPRRRLRCQSLSRFFCSM